MVSEAIFDAISRLLSSHAIESKLLNENEIYSEVTQASIKDDCISIYNNIDCVLVDLFGNDTSLINNCITVYYTFAVRSSNTLITIYVNLDKSSSLEIESIAKEIPAASLYEREIQDMFGVSFVNSIDNRELVHHGNFPLNVHPLNKDFKVNTRLNFEKREQNYTSISGTGVFEVAVGPVHAGIIEPGHFRFSVAGEPIINIEAKLYYTHRGLEKLSENEN